ncbi:glycosyltransferase family 2 protein [Allopontixanthobacter sp.]|uniref:glycosyltransferase family 2 protein n=1 Tax=Allopontixanthobacter sp. TaxID=2906452 RepID=UPI002AB92CE0|nr:glycosyltransferase family 2 protein [Allopontixanthobacter sp.]MDZ4306949.1 glycosyltransferase family 2 protein [Allopontixanthobacter sp.]
MWRRARDRFDKLDFVQFGLRRFFLKSRVKHLHGPAHLHLEPDALTAITVVRNGEPWLQSFLSHHRAIGVRHFVVLDNGSTDSTIEILMSQADVTLLSSDAPYQAYENTMKRYLAERFCSGRWCLCVDVDELFDYPGSAHLPLQGLLAYLDARKYNAVLCQMLDMFGEAPLNAPADDSDEELKHRFRYYDISSIIKSPYWFPVPDARLQMHHGGIRRAVFGTHNGLTKVSLFRMDGVLRPFVEWHHARGASIADFSAVLLHFPFASGFYAKVAEAVESGRYGYLTSDEYSAYLAALDRSPELVLKGDAARLYTGVENLVREGFLVASADYAALAGLPTNN